jgi:hypothetical protein
LLALVEVKAMHESGRELVLFIERLRKRYDILGKTINVCIG